MFVCINGFDKWNIEFFWKILRLGLEFEIDNDVLVEWKVCEYIVVFVEMVFLDWKDWRRLVYYCNWNCENDC